MFARLSPDPGVSRQAPPGAPPPGRLSRCPGPTGGVRLNIQRRGDTLTWTKRVILGPRAGQHPEQRQLYFLEPFPLRKAQATIVPPLRSISPCHVRGMLRAKTPAWQGAGALYLLLDQLHHHEALHVSPRISLIDQRSYYGKEYAMGTGMRGNFPSPPAGSVFRRCQYGHGGRLGRPAEASGARKLPAPLRGGQTGGDSRTPGPF